MQRLASALVWLGLGLGLALGALGCTETHTRCGDRGRAAEVDGALFCFYPQAIVIEGGFECPSAAPGRVDLREGAVCGPEGTTRETLTFDVCRELDLACGAGGGAMCPDIVPAIAACRAGANYADCGGSGPPEFACGPGRLPARLLGPGATAVECLWFTGGCVARGYQKSDCTAESLCCESDWPFAAGNDPGAFDSLLAWGTAPWDRQREAGVAVAIDSTAGGATAATCNGALPSPNLCTEIRPGIVSTPVVERLFNRDFLLRVGPPQNALAGSQLAVEVFVEENRARVCLSQFTDAITSGCTALAARAPICAATGTLTLSALPTSEAELAAVRGTLEVTFAGVGTVALVF